MNRPFDKVRGCTPSEGGGQAAALWLAFLALLGNLVLPAAVSIVFTLAEPSRDLIRLGLCGGSGDTPGKAKPGLLAQHCPLCTVPAAPLTQSPSLTLPTDIAEQNQSQIQAVESVAQVRRGGMQARAPPSVA
jgi:hypothetical protein